ncbi:hypothetical protein ACFLTK_03430, partial [Chloroflexota bacterium]
EAEEAKRVQESAKQAKEEKKDIEGQTKEQSKQETTEIVDFGLYVGIVEMTILEPADYYKIRTLREYLQQVQDLRIELVCGSVDKSTEIIVKATKPIPVMDILREMPLVEHVVNRDKKIQITLKAE